MNDTAPVHKSLWRTSEAIDLAYVALCAALQFAMPLAPARDMPLARHIAGGAFLLATVLLIRATMRAFKGSGQSPKPGKVITSLITSGPFRFSRNPIYLASVLLFMSLALLFANYWFVIALPVLIAAFNLWMVAPEERFLAVQFGEEWTAYCRRVRRWI